MLNERRLKVMIADTIVKHVGIHYHEAIVLVTDEMVKDIADEMMRVAEVEVFKLCKDIENNT